MPHSSSGASRFSTCTTACTETCIAPVTSRRRSISKARRASPASWPCSPTKSPPPPPPPLERMPCVKTLTFALAAALFTPALLHAQSPASIARAVSSITPEDVRRRIGIIADDSMRGRNTPSPELEEVAAWIAAEFRRFGLKPGGDQGSYLQRYAILRKAVDTATSVLRIAGATTVALRPGKDANLIRLGQPLPVKDVTGPAVLYAGPGDTLHPLAPLVAADVKGAWIVVVATATPQGVNLSNPAIGAALDSGAVGLLVVSDRPDAQWQDRLSRVGAPTFSLGFPPSAQDSVAPGLAEIRDANAVPTLGIDPAALRSQTTRSARRLDGVTITLHVEQRVIARDSAPNVIGILEGSDPALKNEYVFFTGHMDHVGATTPQEPNRCRPIGADSICNGADDDASGTIAVVQAAQAFAQLQPRPKRSLVFMTVSGEERGLWGSRYFSERPTVPLASIVADLNTDMVGRNWKDTVVVIGKEHSDLGATLNRVSAAHPELNMRAIDDIWPQENFYFRSDHYNFARKGVPILFFFNGTHPDYHQVGDEVAKIDAEKESRIIKLVFYLGLDVANAAARPKWNPDSYRQIVEGANR